MEEDKYIQKLLNKDFSIGQVNQLLKIFTYTKDIDLDLSDIDINTDEYILRQISKDFKENKYNDVNLLKTLKRLADIKYHDLFKFFNPNFEVSTITKLIEMEQNGLNVDILKNPEFNSKQIMNLTFAIEKGIDADYIFDPSIDSKVMGVLINSELNKIDLKKYYKDYSYEQLTSIYNVLLNKRYNDRDKVEEIFDTKYSGAQIMTLAEALLEDVDLTLLKKTCYSDRQLSLIFDLMVSEIPTKYLEDENLNENQACFIFSQLTKNKKMDSDYLDLIFDKKNNHIMMNLYINMLNNKKLKCYVKEFIDNKYSFEKANELIFGILNDLDIDKYKNIENLNEMHFVRRILEHKKELDAINEEINKINNEDEHIKINKTNELNNLLRLKQQNEKINFEYCLNEKIDINERIKNYTLNRNSVQEFTLNNSDNKNDKFNLPIYDDENLFYLNEDNEIVEIQQYYEDGYLEDILEVAEINNDIGKLNEEWLSSNLKELNNVIKDFFILKYDEKNDCVEIYDLFKNKSTQSNIDYNYEEYLSDYYCNVFYSDLADSEYENLIEEYSEYYEPLFDSMDELNKYGMRNFNCDYLVEEVSCNYETSVLSISKQNASEFLFINEENIDEEKWNYMYNVLKCEKKAAEAVINGETYFVTLYENGKKKDSVYGIYGEDVVEQSIEMFGKIKRVIGNFKNIDCCIKHIKEQDKEIER